MTYLLLKRLAVMGAAVAAFWGGAVLARAQPCDDGVRRVGCSAEARAELPKLYGVPPMEELADSGAQIVRAYFIDDYDRPNGLLTFVRAPGSGPRVEWRNSSPGSSKPLPPRLTHELSLTVWDEVQREGYLFDRALVPEPPRASMPPPPPCPHSWVVQVESVDPDGKICRRIEDACRAALTARYGFRMAAIAVQAIPGCELLRMRKNNVYRLLECSSLEGDRITAAQATERFHDLLFSQGNLFGLIDRAAELAWPGIPLAKGVSAGVEVWQQQDGRRRFRPTRIVGEAADRVRIDGEIRLSDGASDGGSKSVPATLIWTRRDGFDFQLRSLKAAP